VTVALVALIVVALLAGLAAGYLAGVRATAQVLAKMTPEQVKAVAQRAASLRKDN
jgi:uncharacterized protein YneF (UPF0154 family)